MIPGARSPVLVLLLAACGPASPPGAVVVGARDTGAATQLAPGDVLAVRLPARLSTGRSWQVEGDGAGLLRLLGREVEPAPRPGGEDTEVLWFAGAAAGRTTLTLRYGRPWGAAGGDRPSWSVEVDVAGAYVGDWPGPRTAVRVPSAAAAPPAPDLADPLTAHLDLCDPGDGSHSRCTPVKDQGDCGSCFAFATVGVVENLLRFADPSRVPDLSEQYLVSCDTQGFDCNSGGYIGFDYFVSRRSAPPEEDAGAVYEADFPYQATDVACGSAPHPHHEKVAYWGPAAPFNGGEAERRIALKQALLDHGPLWVNFCADAATSAWDGRGGPIPGSACPVPNHAVVLVGWDDAGRYWIFRNSWGPGWGDHGYGRIAYGVNAMALDSAYAVLAPADPAPVADGGPTRLLSSGSRATLDGSASADPGGIATWSWLQVGGWPVTLSGADTAHPRFDVPYVPSDERLTFRLTVTNAAGAQASALSVVYAHNGPVPGEGTGGGGGGCATAPGGLVAAGLALLALRVAMRRRRAGAA